MTQESKALRREVHALRSILQTNDRETLLKLDPVKKVTILTKISEWSKLSSAVMPDIYGQLPVTGRNPYLIAARHIHGFLADVFRGRDTNSLHDMQKDGALERLVNDGLLLLVERAKREGPLPYQELLFGLYLIIKDALETIDFETTSLYWIHPITRSIIAPQLISIDDTSFRQKVVDLCIDHIIQAIKFLSLPATSLETSASAMEISISLVMAVPDIEVCMPRLRPFFLQLQRTFPLLVDLVYSKANGGL